MDWDLVKRAQNLAGLKGYVTNIDPDVLAGDHVVTAYHDLYQVERSFRMTKTDLAARPVFHRLRDSIEAHLTIVFARVRRARGVSRGPSPHRGVDQQDREDAAAVADRHDHPRPPADHRRTPYPCRGPTDPGRPRWRWSLNRCNSGLTTGDHSTASPQPSLLPSDYSSTRWRE